MLHCTQFQSRDTQQSIGFDHSVLFVLQQNNFFLVRGWEGCIGTLGRGWKGCIGALGRGCEGCIGALGRDWEGCIGVLRRGW